MTATVTAVGPKDPTGAARQRRFRQRQRDAALTPVPDTIEVICLAARLGSGAATADDMRQAERLLLLLVG